MEAGPAFAANAFASPTCLRLLANGATFDEILADYAFLEREDIYAAIEYAAHQADHTVLQAL